MSLPWPEPNADPSGPPRVFAGVNSSSPTIAIRATVNSIRYRDNSGSGFIAVGIGAGGFSSASGTFDNAARAVEVGDVGVFTGTAGEFRGRPALRVHSVQWQVRPLGDQWLRAARREGIALSEALHARLVGELGGDWPFVLARNPERLTDVAFARFHEKTRKRLLESVYALCGVSLAERDMLAAGMTTAQIRLTLDRIARAPFDRAARGFDARLLIPGGFITPLHARDLHASGAFFKPHIVISNAMTAIWHELALGAGRERHNDHDRFTNIRAQGSTAFPFDILVRVLWKRSKLDKEAIAGASASLSETEIIGASIALKRAAKVERELLSLVEARASRPIDPRVKSRGRRARKSDIPFDDEQQVAIDLGINRRISIITGPPGCGKTRACRAIADSLRNVFGVALSARAARVLADRAGIETLTVHKFLTMSADARADSFGARDALIIDECSMLSSSDLRDLLSIVRRLEIERVILVGDPAQLQPIDEGRPFADLVEAGVIPVTTLLTNHRSASGGGITALTTDIRENAFTKDRLLSGAYAGVIGVHEKDGTKALAAILARYRALIDGGASPKDIAILVPFKKPSIALSTVRLNGAVRSFLGYSPRQAHVGEIVIGTRNDYERNIINGAVGVITQTDEDAFAIEFDGMVAPSISTASDTEKRILPSGVAFGYAFTIHKAQGSEFEHVIVAIDGSNDFLLRKSSLYTAVTRARSSLSIIGDLDAAEAMSRSEDRRTSVLQALLGLPGPKTNSSLDMIEAGRTGVRDTDDEIEF